MCNIKFALVLLGLLIIFQVGKGQCDSIEAKYFLNDGITFSLAYSGGGVYAEKNRRLPGYYIKLRMSKDCRKYLLARDSAFWVNKLQDSASDWATNVILYFLYERDASIFLIMKDRSQWSRYKSNEVAYWRNYFTRIN